MVMRLIQSIREKKKIKNSFLSVGDVWYNKRMERSVYKPSGNLVNRVTGVISVVVGLVTFFVPMTTIPLILLGIFLFSCPIGIKTLIRGLWRDIKFWVGVRW